MRRTADSSALDANMVSTRAVLGPRACRFTDQNHWTLFILAGASGALLCLTHGYAPWLAIPAVVPLLLVLTRSSLRQSFYLGLLCGFVETWILWGVAYVGVGLFASLCLAYGLFRAAFAMTCVALRWNERRLCNALVPAAVWCVLEWLHGHVPYTLPNLLGDTQHEGPLLPLARLGGTHLVSFMIVWLAAACVMVVIGWHRGGGIWRATSRLAPGVMSLLALLVWAELEKPVPVAARTVVVVQGAITPTEYATSETDILTRDRVREAYRSLTLAAPDADLTVWPETAVWEVFARGTDFDAFVRNVAAGRSGHLLAGLPRVDEHGDLRNSAVLFDRGREAAVDKRRIVVGVEAQFVPGDAVAALPLDHETIGVLFCLESALPDYSLELMRHGASLIVVLAEGGRFADTPVARMHAQRSIVRAVETGRGVVHAGQGGWSTVVTSAGVAEPFLPPFFRGIMQAEVEIVDASTPFVRFGHWIVAIAVALLAVAVVDRLRLHPPSAGADGPPTRAADTRAADL